MTRICGLCRVSSEPHGSLSRAEAVRYRHEAEFRVQIPCTPQLKQSLLGITGIASNIFPQNARDCVGYGDVINHKRGKMIDGWGGSLYPTYHQPHAMPTAALPVTRLLPPSGSWHPALYGFIPDRPGRFQALTGKLPADVWQRLCV